MGSKIYLNIVDQIEKARYEVWVPEGFDPAGHHPYFGEYKTDLVHQPFENDMAQSRMSIVKMARLSDMGAQLHFPDSLEMNEILNNVRSFLEYVEDKMKNIDSDDLKMQVEMIRNFRDALKNTHGTVVEQERRKGRYPDSYKSISDILAEASV
mgnify:CR=1 FL=1